MTQESTYNMRTWHDGAPPHVGWWNASTMRHFWLWRWWDGKDWSKPAQSHHSAHNASISAMRKEDVKHQAVMKWNDYWPTDARVPRMVPQ